MCYKQVAYSCQSLVRVSDRSQDSSVYSAAWGKRTTAKPTDLRPYSKSRACTWRTDEMAEEEVKAVKTVKPDEKWALKDALIAIPFLASALALTWEVGYFSRVRGGAFNLFSISEHISFALQALPIALTASTTVLWWVMVPKGVGGTRSEAFKNGLRVGVPLGVFLVSGIILLILYNKYHIIYTSNWVACAIGGCWTSIELYSPRPIDKWAMVVLGAAGVFGFTMALGFDVANSEVSTPKRLSAIRIGEAEHQVKVLRAGDRGVLYFDPAQKKFGLVPWDSVKKIDWDTGLFPRPTQKPPKGP
jgi:hypothetical protein